jgi:RNA polymerase sigma-70 factor (ECF subfamily)
LSQVEPRATGTGVKPRPGRDPSPAEAADATPTRLLGSSRLRSARRRLVMTDCRQMEPSQLDAFRAGDPEILRAVYGEFARPVATVARSVVGDDQGLVDEIVQQTFTRAWRSAAHFQAGRALAPWLYTIARRTAIDAVRVERRPTRGDHEPEADVAVTAESLEQTWERYEIRRAIDALPPEEAEVIRLGHLVGLTHPEISARLGVPLGTVKSRSFRAHRRLSALLAHLQADDPPATENRTGPPPVYTSTELP